MKFEVPPSWQEVSKAFTKAQELDVQSREAYLNDLSPKVREEVLSLLKYDSSENDFLEVPPELPPTFADTLQTFTPGDKILDFELLEQIGEGSFGSVFKAMQVSLNREVAVKITPNIGNEAQVMAHLEHPSIVSVHSETLDREKGIRFICMQFVPGFSLEHRLEQHECLNVDTILQYGVDLADALTYAHGRNILHLDVKPSNILLHSSGRPYLTDFNVSVNKDQKGATGVKGGTKNFMPPEQEEYLNSTSFKSDLDGTADIYSLGRVLEDCLEISDEEDLYFRSIVKKCLEKNRVNRFQAASDLKRALVACQEFRAIQNQLPKGGWYLRLGRKYPTLVLTLSILFPHFIGSIINISYNSMRIVAHLTPTQQTVFEKLLLLDNTIVYGTAVLLLWLVLRPLIRLSSTDFASLRRKTLLAPVQVAAISIAGWGISAIVFPFGIHAWGEPLAASIFGHFFVSFFLSTLVATTYSALNAQYFLLRVIYPKLWQGELTIKATARRELSPFIPKLRPLYYLSGTVPLVGAILMVAVGPESLAGRDYAIYRGLLAGFIALGISGIFYSMISSKNLSETLSVFTGIPAKNS